MSTLLVDHSDLRQGPLEPLFVGIRRGVTKRLFRPVREELSGDGVGHDAHSDEDAGPRRQISVGSDDSKSVPKSRANEGGGGLPHSQIDMTARKQVFVTGVERRERRSSREFKQSSPERELYRANGSQR